MKTYLMTRNTIVLLVLVALTLMSWAVALNADPASGTKISGVSVMLLAFFKVRMVIQNFMEVRHAPLVLKISADSWVVIACGVVVACYLGYV